jgi:hypothetical protein
MLSQKLRARSFASTTHLALVAWRTHSSPYSDRDLAARQSRDTPGSERSGG